MNVWVANEILTQADFDKIQEVVDSFSVPNGIEHIPYHIGSGFNGFKADQWRLWTTVFSLVSLKECFHLNLTVAGVYTYMAVKSCVI